MLELNNLHDLTVHIKGNAISEITTEIIGIVLLISCQQTWWYAGTKFLLYFT